MFFFNWNDPNKSAQDDGTGASQTNGQASSQVADPAANAQPANDYLEPTQPAQPAQSVQQQPPAPQQPTDYVDAYTPPAQHDQAHLKHTPWNADQNDTQNAQEEEDVQAVVDQQVTQAVEPVQPVQGDESADVEEADQSLESQNIFDLLGASDGEDSEKEAFLDELQQVVWEDFVQNDVQTILTEAEFAEFSQIVNQSEIANEEMQEKALEYLEKVVPDFEDILLEKALQLKQDLVWERVAGMKEFFAGKDQQLQAVVQAEALFKQDRWDDGAQLLNTLS
jgi:hypothetical protein